MKTLSSRFLVSVDVPDRPWWKKSEEVYRRRDGREAKSLQDIPEIDYNDPLPRPLFEMGQIWLLILGEGSRTYTLHGRLEVKVPNGITRYWNVTGPYMPAQVSEDQLHEYLVDGYLLYDPIGQKAPWAPWKLA